MMTSCRLLEDALDQDDDDTLTVKKNRSCYHIFFKNENTRPWVKINEAYVLSVDRNAYGKAQLQVAICIDDHESKIIDSIDKCLKRLMATEMDHHVIDNVKLTASAVQDRFIPSWNWNENNDRTMRTNVANEWCTVYNAADHVPINQDDDEDDEETLMQFFQKRMNDDKPIMVALEPTFCWFMNCQFGVHWKIRQAI